MHMMISEIVPVRK